MLFKILVFLAVLALIYIVFFKSPKRGTKKDDTKEIENFVECDKCGTFVEVKEAVLSSAKYICKECVKGHK